MPKILVVEDEAPNTEILKRLLAMHNFDVVVAGNKRDAIELATNEEIDLVLMDIGIPDAEGEEFNKDGGLEAARWLKSNAETASIPVIATSASAMLDEKQRFIEAGCDDVQSKPFDFPTLIQAIRDRLEGG
jgi:CheY-like chemotaxis protein